MSALATCCLLLAVGSPDISEQSLGLDLVAKIDQELFEKIREHPDEKSHKLCGRWDHTNHRVSWVGWRRECELTVDVKNLHAQQRIDFSMQPDSFLEQLRRYGSAAPQQDLFYLLGLDGVSSIEGYLSSTKEHGVLSLTITLNRARGLLSGLGYKPVVLSKNQSANLSARIRPAFIWDAMMSYLSRIYPIHAGVLTLHLAALDGEFSKSWLDDILGNEERLMRWQRRTNHDVIWLEMKNPKMFSRYLSSSAQKISEQSQVKIVYKDPKWEGSWAGQKVEFYPSMTSDIHSESSSPKRALIVSGRVPCADLDFCSGLAELKVWRLGSTLEVSIKVAKSKVP